MVQLVYANQAENGISEAMSSVAVTTIGAHLGKSATGGIWVGHSVTWCFRFPLHAQLCKYHCHMDYAFISVGDIAFCR